MKEKEEKRNNKNYGEEGFGALGDLQAHWDFKLRHDYKNHFFVNSVLRLFFPSSSLLSFHRHWHRTRKDSSSIQQH
jgi:hypothetical protein